MSSVIVSVSPGESVPDIGDIVNQLTVGAGIV